MIYKIRIIFFLGIFFFSVNTNVYAQIADGYEIKGRFDTFPDIKKVILAEKIFEAVRVIDQTEIDTQGAFSFKGRCKGPHYYFIIFGDTNTSGNNPVPVYVISNTHVEILIRASKWSNDYTYEGDSNNAEIEYFITKTREIAYDMIKKASGLFKNGISDSLRKIDQRIFGKYDRERIRSILNEAAQSNQDVGAIYTAIYFLMPKVTPREYTKSIFEENVRKDHDLYSKIDKKYYELYKWNAEFAYMHSILMEPRFTEEGTYLQNFTLKNPEGKKVSLSDFKGKYLLVDFWASWCGPCRKENPAVVKVYSKYHSYGLEILGVSLDTKKKAWVAAIKADGLVWNHVSQLKGWETTITKKLNITGVPFNLLLDKDGKIIAQNLKGEDLENKLKEIFGE